uniref:Uncharacterized protein n=1 Tax=Arundo donax TaxID=35708 RepID=A0A0A9H0H4_ARUDO
MLFSDIHGSQQTNTPRTQEPARQIFWRCMCRKTSTSH